MMKSIVEAKVVMTQEEGSDVRILARYEDLLEPVYHDMIETLVSSLIYLHSINQKIESFIVNDDDSESDDNEAPRRKKTRSLWDESESEESDRSWGKRKRKAAKYVNSH